MFASPTRSFLSGLVLVSSLVASTLSQSARAQDDAGEGATETEASEAPVDLDDEETTAEASGEPSTATPEDEGVDKDEEADKKKKGDVQLLIGARYRMMVLPKGLMNMFGVDGGRTVVRNGLGGEVGGYFGKSADGFLVMGSVWWLGYGLKPTAFKGKNDDETAWEIIESTMGAVYLTVDTMWDHKITTGLSFNIGAGFGLGIVTGKLFRNEAYVNNINPDLPADNGWPNLSYCPGPQGSVECPSDGNYGQATKWPVYPWINFQLGLRYQPVDWFVGRFDMGLGSSGIWFGLGADYSLFL